MNNLIERKTMGVRKAGREIENHSSCILWSLWKFLFTHFHCEGMTRSDVEVTAIYTVERKQNDDWLLSFFEQAKAYIK
jgi:hypothetical protein